MNNQEIYQAVQAALEIKDNDERIKFVKTFLKEIGYFDKKSRFEIYSEYETATSVVVREPSARWPFSKLKHVYTKKYLQSLLQSPKFQKLVLEDATQGLGCEAQKRKM